MSNWLSKGHRMRESKLSMLLAQGAFRTAKEKGVEGGQLVDIHQDMIRKELEYRVLLCEMVADCEEEISQIPEPQGKVAGDHTGGSGV